MSAPGSAESGAAFERRSPRLRTLVRDGGRAKCVPSASAGPIRDRLRCGSCSGVGRRAQLDQCVGSGMVTTCDEGGAVELVPGVQPNAGSNVAARIADWPPHPPGRGGASELLARITSCRLQHPHHTQRPSGRSV